MCPTLITGKTENGGTIYVRYRWGQLSVRLDPRDPAPHGGADGVWILERELDPDGIDGWISFESLREITDGIIDWPEVLSPEIYDEDDDIQIL
jgi:hypothetical protein